MKHIISISFLLLFIGFSATLSAQGKSAPKVAEVEFVVKGNCGMCKDRIENALTVKGVKAAAWDGESQVCRVVYKPSKITVDRMKELVLEAGHDTQEVMASEKAYTDLHECCKYRENPSCE